MEFWLTVSKLIVFIYIVFSYIYLNVVNLPWVILTLLLFLSVNVLISIFKNDTYKNILTCVSIGLVMLFAWKIHPFFILFLPMNLYEIIFRYILLLSHHEYALDHYFLINNLSLRFLLRPKYIHHHRTSLK